MAGKITITSSGGIPGGSDKQVQFNDAGAFGGGATLYWDKASGRLGIGLNNPSDLLSISDGNRCLSFGVDGQNIDCGVQAQSFVFQAANVDSANEPMRIRVVPKGNDYTSFMMRGYGSEIGELTTYGSRFTFTSRVGYETSINYNVAEDVNIWKAIAGGNPYFEIYGRNAADTDNDYVKMRMGTGAIDAFVVDVFDSDDAARHPILLNPSGGNVGINTTTINETLNVGGAIRLGTSALTNAGTIRWNGTNFQGYKDAAWVNLDGSGSPGGANTQIQFNNSGVFGGDSDFCWTSGTNLLNLVNAQIQSKDNADADFTLVSTPLTHAWTWDYRACNFIQNRQSKVLATDGTSHSFAAGLALHHQDNDGTNYQTSGTIHQMYGLETHLTGTTTNASYKDMVGVFSRVMNRTEWNLRGCSGFITGVHQYGEGIASNEFHIFDPAAGAEGGHAQCKSSAGLQIVMHHHFADEDATHLARGLMIDVFGKRITAGITMSSNVDGAYGSGYMKYGIDMSAASTSDAAIRMPGSSVGNLGTCIEYDPNDYTWYDRTNNAYNWVAEGVTGLVVCGNVANAVAIRVNSTLLYINRSPDVDSLGQHYLTVT